MKRLTKKEEVIMNHFWDQGPLFVRELRELYPEPKPHFSTLSTQVRTLEEEGFIDHKSYGPTYQYFASLVQFDSKYFIPECGICSCKRRENYCRTIERID